MIAIRVRNTLPEQRSTASAALPPLQENAIRKIVDINIVSAVLLAKAAAPHMRCGSAMLFVSSYTAFNPAPPIAMCVAWLLSTAAALE